LDSFALIYVQGQLFLNNPWPAPLLVFYPLFQGIIVTVIVSFLASLVTRVIRHSWLALFLAAGLIAAVFPGTPFTLSAVQPYHWKVLLLLCNFLILTWTFTRFDVLTLFAAAFGFAFCWQNYNLF